MSLFVLHIQSHSPLREAKTGTKAEHEAGDKNYLLACSSLLVISVFLKNPGLPARDSIIDNDLGPLPLITNFKNAPYVCLSYGDIFSTEVPAFQMTLVCIKLTQN